MGGGLLWLISGGDASRISQAKELIIGSITGLVILSASYIILLQVNPNLVNLKSIALTYIPKIENLAVSRNNTTASDYRNSPCATDAELASGINFYATGYYKPAWEDSDTFRCVVAMQCSCPAGYGKDMTKNCDALYGKTFPNYHPCAAFPANTPYCNMTKSGSSPKAGDIAGPGNCTANLPTGSKVCFKGNTYTITDTGSGIQGKRLDIWSGSDLDQANKNTGVGLFKKGACK
jgi:3D (Asp-Asp-Asp) domain-containing protein